MTERLADREIGDFVICEVDGLDVVRRRYEHLAISLVLTVAEERSNGYMFFHCAFPVEVLETMLARRIARGRAAENNE